MLYAVLMLHFVSVGVAVAKCVICIIVVFLLEIRISVDALLMLLGVAHVIFSL